MNKQYLTHKYSRILAFKRRKFLHMIQPIKYCAKSYNLIRNSVWLHLYEICNDRGEKNKMMVAKVGRMSSY